MHVALALLDQLFEIWRLALPEAKKLPHRLRLLEQPFQSRRLALPGARELLCRFRARIGEAQRRGEGAGDGRTRAGRAQLAHRSEAVQREAQVAEAEYERQQLWQLVAARRASGKAVRADGKGAPQEYGQKPRDRTQRTRSGARATEQDWTRGHQDFHVRVEALPPWRSPW
eukprot:6453442-Prymnesium_polylepis.1